MAVPAHLPKVPGEGLSEGLGRGRAIVGALARPGLQRGAGLLGDFGEDIAGLQFPGEGLHHGLPLVGRDRGRGGGGDLLGGEGQDQGGQDEQGTTHGASGVLQVSAEGPPGLGGRVPEGRQVAGIHGSARRIQLGPRSSPARGMRRRPPPSGVWRWMSYSPSTRPLKAIQPPSGDQAGA